MTYKQTLSQIGTYGYDALDLLTSETQGPLTGAFSYDPNGNRLSGSLNNINATLSYSPNTNRLKSITVGPVTEGARLHLPASKST